MRAAVSLLCLAASITTGGLAHGGSTVTLTTSNLIEIEAGEGHYHLWAIVGGTAASVGAFNIYNGTVVDPGTFQRIDAFQTATDIAAASEMWVTVEPEGGAEATPSIHHVLAGTVGVFLPGRADLTTMHPSALGLDFSDVTGGFVLDTPSTADTADYMNGVWFLDPAPGGDQAGFALPALPAGWEYATWVADVNSGDPIPMPMGSFFDPANADNDGAGCTAGPDPGMGFPGQDFIVACNSYPVKPNLLKGWTLVLSIEPDPNNGPNPFHSLEPLRTAFGGSIPSSLTRREYSPLTNSAAAFPTAVAIISPSSPVTPASWGSLKARYR